MSKQIINDVIVLNRNDTKATWLSQNPVLAKGEVGVEIDTSLFKLGNGVDHWVDLAYSGEFLFANLNKFNAHKDSPAHYYERSNELRTATPLLGKDTNGNVSYTEFTKLNFGTYEIINCAYAPGKVSSRVMVNAVHIGESAVIEVLDVATGSSGILVFNNNTLSYYKELVNVEDILTIAKAKPSGKNIRHGIGFYKATENSKINYKIHGHTEKINNIFPLSKKNNPRVILPNPTGLNPIYSQSVDLFSTGMPNLPSSEIPGLELPNEYSVFGEIATLSITANANTVPNCQGVQIYRSNLNKGTYTLSLTIDYDIVSTILVAYYKTALSKTPDINISRRIWEDLGIIAPSDLNIDIFSAAGANLLKTHLCSGFKVLVTNRPNTDTFDEMLTNTIATADASNFEYGRPSKIQLSFTVDTPREINIIFLSTMPVTPVVNTCFITPIKDCILCESYNINSVYNTVSSTMLIDNVADNLISTTREMQTINSEVGLMPLFKHYKVSDEQLLSIRTAMLEFSSTADSTPIQAMFNITDDTASELEKCVSKCSGYTVTNDPSYAGVQQKYVNLASFVRIPSGEYTFSADISSSYADASGKVEICFGTPHNIAHADCVEILPSGSRGHCAKVFNIPEMADYSISQIKLYLTDNVSSTAQNIAFANIRLEPGNTSEHRINPLPYPSPARLTATTTDLPDLNGLHGITIANAAARIQTIGVPVLLSHIFGPTCTASSIALDQYPDAIRVKKGPENPSYPMIGFILNGLDKHTPYILKFGSTNVNASKIYMFDERGINIPCCNTNESDKFGLYVIENTKKVLCFAETAGDFVVDYPALDFEPAYTYLNELRTVGDATHKSRKFSMRLRCSGYPVGETSDIYRSDKNVIERNTKEVSVALLYQLYKANPRLEIQCTLEENISQPSSSSAISFIIPKTSPVYTLITSGLNIPKVNAGEYLSSHLPNINYELLPSYSNSPELVSVQVTQDDVKIYVRANPLQSDTIRDCASIARTTQEQELILKDALFGNLILPRNSSVEIACPANKKIDIYNSDNSILLTTMLSDDNITKNARGISGVPCNCSESFEFDTPIIGERVVLISNNKTVNPTTTSDVVYDRNTGESVDVQLNKKFNSTGGTISGDVSVEGILYENGSRVYSEDYSPLHVGETEPGVCAENGLFVQTVPIDDPSSDSSREIIVSTSNVGDKHTILPVNNVCKWEIIGSNITIIAYEESGASITIPHVIQANVAQNARTTQYFSHIIAYTWDNSVTPNVTNQVIHAGQFVRLELTEQIRYVNGNQINGDTVKIMCIKTP